MADEYLEIAGPEPRRVKLSSPDKVLWPEPGLTKRDLADFLLAVADPFLAMHDIISRRRDKQPLEYPSAGSTFKRPEGHFAGALIEQCGLKGVSVGGAQVSEKHAGFIVNIGGATARDMLELMRQVEQRVFEQTGVQLEPEVRILGED